LRPTITCRVGIPCPRGATANAVGGVTDFSSKARPPELRMPQLNPLSPFPPCAADEAASVGRCHRGGSPRPLSDSGESLLCSDYYESFLTSLAILIASGYTVYKQEPLRSCRTTHSALRSSVAAACASYQLTLCEPTNPSVRPLRGSRCRFRRVSDPSGS
jgi:hypothetical protein